MQEKFPTILDAWQNDLSLLRKVMIVNTLIGSQLVHKMNVLPIIPKKLMAVFNEIISNYIWKNKRAKIPLEALNLPKDQGSLKLVSSETKEQSLKINWVWYYHCFEEIKILADYALNNKNSVFIWKMIIIRGI